VEALTGFIINRAGSVLVGILILTLGALSQIVDFETRELKLEIDPSIESMLPEDDEGRKFYDHIRRLFGSDETILVALVDDDIFKNENLVRIQRMTRRLEKEKGVHRVVSLANALNLRVTEFGDLEVAPFFEELPLDAAARETLRSDVFDNPVYAGNLVSEDGRATLLFVYLRDLPERELRASGVVGKIERIAREEGGGAQIEVMGGLYAKSEIGRLLLEDLQRTLPLAVIVAMLVAWASFRSLRGVLIPALTTIIAVIWMLGFISAIGIPLNLMTIIIPTLLIVVGFAYAVHVVSDYYEILAMRILEGGSEGEKGKPAVWEALRQVALPVVLTGVTTSAGFISLATSPVLAIKQFGVFSTLGVIMTVFVSLTFAPALLALLPERRKVRDRTAGGRFDRAANRLADFDVRYRNGILWAGGSLAVIALLGTTQIHVSSDFIDRGTDLYRSAQVLDEHLQGSNAFYVVLETDFDGAFKEPGNLQEVRAFQDWLESQPEIGGTTSLVDSLMLINRGFNGGAPEFLAIPKSRSLVSQLLFFGSNDELERFVDTRYRTAGIHVRCNINDFASMADLLDRIERHAESLPDHLRAKATGSSVLMTRTLSDIVRGQAASLLFAFAMILAVLALLFTSVRVGMLALIPNALPVLFYFGLLGIGGITLNSTTGLVACLVLGIAVDDTIHFLVRFNGAAKRLVDETKGVGEALRAVGRPVTYTSIALCLGFLVMTTSNFTNQAQFGALAAVTLAFAWLLDVTFTPALASRMQIVSLWDALTLDLGDDPHRSIPFFRGLRKTQARITALMTSMAKFPQGHRLFSAGEAGDEMYVVIDGRLAVSITTDNGTVAFGSLVRGDIVGEVALFHGSRTADVTAESDVRLLRFTRASLERIRRRYPRTGAQLYANLAEILADRVATTTERVK